MRFATRTSTHRTHRGADSTAVLPLLPNCVSVKWLLDFHARIALEKTKLITSRQTCKYSRSGRTDKVRNYDHVFTLAISACVGLLLLLLFLFILFFVSARQGVSAFGQVVALMARSSLKVAKADPGKMIVQTNNPPHPQELDYARILNRVMQP